MERRIAPQEAAKARNKAKWRLIGSLFIAAIFWNSLSGILKLAIVGLILWFGFIYLYTRGDSFEFSDFGRLNRKLPSSTPLLWALAGAVILLLLASQGNNTTQSELFAYIVLGIGAIIATLWVVNLNRARAKREALTTLPDRIPDAIVSKAACFEAEKISLVEKPAPQIGGWGLGLQQDREKLIEHYDYLNDVYERSANAIALATRTYDEDRSVFENQLFILYRLLHQAASVCNRLESRFPMLRGEFKDIPTPTISPLPAAPRIASAEKVARAQKGARRGAAHQASLAVQVGMKNPLAGLSVAVLAGAANVIMFQRHVRNMRAAHGEIDRYCLTLKDELDRLKEAHRKLVQKSTEVMSSAFELRGLLVWAGEMERGGFPPPDALDDDSMAKLRMLKQHALAHKARAVDYI